jgi:hypothetical protein
MNSYVVPSPRDCPRRRHPKTAEARDDLRQLLNDLPAGEVMQVDLQNADYDISPLDEIIVSNVLCDRTSKRLLERYVVLENVSRYTLSELEKAIRLSPSRPCAVFVRNGQHVEIVGEIGEKALATLSWLRDRGQGTAAELAADMSIQLTAANNRLSDLHRTGLVLRVSKEAMRGPREFLYEPVV